MIKKFENFFGGTHINDPGTNFNSSGTKGGINQNPDEFTQPVELTSRINNLKEEICLDIAESNLDLEDLRKLKNLLNDLK